MTIDLLKLAKKVEDTYQDVELSFGKMRIYHVPEPLLWSYKLDRPEPVQPAVRMKLATGQSQERAIKAGDEGYEEWQLNLQRYEEELGDLRIAVRYVAALRDIEYPDISNPPPMATNVYANGHWPENEMLRKKIWLDFTVLALPVDMAKVQTAIMELAGHVTPEAVEEVKKNSELEHQEE